MSFSRVVLYYLEREQKKKTKNHFLEAYVEEKFIK